MLRPASVGAVFRHAPNPEDQRQQMLERPRRFPGLLDMTSGPCERPECMQCMQCMQWRRTNAILQKGLDDAANENTIVQVMLTSSTEELAKQLGANAKLQEANAKLQEEIDRQRHDYNILDKDYTGLSEKYGNLKEKNSNLKEKYDNLKKATASSSLLSLD